MDEKDARQPSAKTRRAQAEAAARKRRLEVALRDNLKKRKRQARLRAEKDEPPGDKG